MSESGIARPRNGQSFTAGDIAVSSEEQRTHSPVDRRKTHRLEFQLRQRKVFLGLLGAVVMVGSTAGDAGAQARDGQWRLPPQGGGSTRRATSPPPSQPTVVIVTPGAPAPVYYEPVRRYPVAYAVIPAILMSDGSVWANFGFGYEPVVRPCAAAFVSGSRVIASNGVVLSQAPQPPTYTQPVPSQMTASQQLLPSNRSGPVVVSNAARVACFSRDAVGRVYVYR